MNLPPYLWPGGLEARPSRTEPACFFLSSRLGHRSRAARFSALSRASVGRPRAQQWPRVPHFLVANGWDPVVSHVILPSVVTEPETSSTSTESTEETGISYPNTLNWSYKRVAACPLSSFSI
jgi:hypothetical protein